jgi:hypothetical protein
MLASLAGFHFPKGIRHWGESAGHTLERPDLCPAAKPSRDDRQRTERQVGI